MSGGPGGAWGAGALRSAGPTARGERAAHAAAAHLSLLQVVRLDPVVPLALARDAGPAGGHGRRARQVCRAGKGAAQAAGPLWLLHQRGVELVIGATEAAPPRSGARTPAGEDGCVAQRAGEAHEGDGDADASQGEGAGFVAQHDRHVLPVVARTAPGRRTVCVCPGRRPTTVFRAVPRVCTVARTFCPRKWRRRRRPRAAGCGPSKRESTGLLRSAGGGAKARTVWQWTACAASSSATSRGPPFLWPMSRRRRSTAAVAALCALRAAARARAPPSPPTPYSSWRILLHPGALTVVRNDRPAVQPPAVRALRHRCTGRWAPAVRTPNRTRGVPAVPRMLA